MAKDEDEICYKTSVNDYIQEILNYDNVIYTDFIVGDTKQCYERATEQII